MVFPQRRAQEGGEVPSDSIQGDLEETGIRAERLALLDGNSTIVLKDEGKGLKWQNRFFIFRASGRAVRLNVENTDYKWVGFGQVCRNRDIDRMIYNKEKCLSRIRKSL